MWLEAAFWIAVAALTVFVIYWLSRLQMKGWIDQLDSKLTKYLPKKDDDLKS